MPANSTELTSPSGEVPARVAVDLRRFPWIRRLAADYAFDFRSVAPFFSGDPSEPRRAWSQIIPRVQAHAHERNEIAAVIARQQDRRSAPEAARLAARRLADAGTVAIVTGQQAGLFGGPLFTLLKALTALKLAEKVSREHNVPAVAVFWIDAEDHDWNEVAVVYGLRRGARSRTPCRYRRGPPADPAPVATVKLDRSIAHGTRRAREHAPPTEFRAGLMRRSARGVCAGRRHGRALRPLARDGCSAPAGSSSTTRRIRRRSRWRRELFTRELQSPGETASGATRGADLVERGYHAQVQPQDDGVALFHLDGGRRPIRQQDGQFVVGETRADAAAICCRKRATGRQLQSRTCCCGRSFRTRSSRRSVTSPDRTSSRISASCAASTIDFGVPMPLMYPRAIGDPRRFGGAPLPQKYQLPLEALQPQDEVGAQRAARNADPAGGRRVVLRRRHEPSRSRWRG